MKDALRDDASPEALAHESIALEQAVETLEAEIDASDCGLFAPAPPHAALSALEDPQPDNRGAHRASLLAFAVALLAVAAAMAALALRPAATSGTRIAAARSPAVATPAHQPGREIAVSAWRLGAARGAVRWFAGPDRFSLALAGNREGLFASIHLAAAGAPSLELRISAAPDPALRATHAVEFAFAPPAPGGATVSVIDMPRIHGGALVSTSRDAPAEVAGVVIRTGAQTFTASLSDRPEDELYNRALMGDAAALSVVLRTDAGDTLTLEIELPRAVAAIFEAARGSVRPYVPAP